MNVILMTQLRSHLERAGITLLEARRRRLMTAAGTGQAWLARQVVATS